MLNVLGDASHLVRLSYFGAASAQLLKFFFFLSFLLTDVPFVSIILGDKAFKNVLVTAGASKIKKNL